MKRTEENRYANSANLFRFCKEALCIKHNFEVKVIDQHVGAMLGYDPADCSHWKKGKKNIRSVHTIETIAANLEIDSRLVSDLVSGKTSLEDSLAEYRGYDVLKFNKDITAQSLQRDLLLSVTQNILQKADVHACPVLLPELALGLNNITLTEQPLEAGQTFCTTTTDTGYQIAINPQDNRAETRFQVAREIGRLCLFTNIEASALDETMYSQLSLFALLLLIPSPLLQIAAQESVSTRDLIQQLSEDFWVSRSLINARLKDFFAFKN